MWRNLTSHALPSCQDCNTLHGNTYITGRLVTHTPNALPAACVHVLVLVLVQQRELGMREARIEALLEQNDKLDTVLKVLGERLGGFVMPGAAPVPVPGAAQPPHAPAMCPDKRAAVARWQADAAQAGGVDDACGGDVGCGADDDEVRPAWVTALESDGEISLAALKQSLRDSRQSAGMSPYASGVFDGLRGGGGGAHGYGDAMTPGTTAAALGSKGDIIAMATPCSSGDSVDVCVDTAGQVDQQQQQGARLPVVPALSQGHAASATGPGPGVPPRGSLNMDKLRSRMQRLDLPADQQEDAASK